MDLQRSTGKAQPGPGAARMACKQDGISFLPIELMQALSTLVTRPSRL